MTFPTVDELLEVGHDDERLPAAIEQIRHTVYDDVTRTLWTTGDPAAVAHTATRDEHALLDLYEEHPEVLARTLVDAITRLALRDHTNATPGANR